MIPDVHAQPGQSRLVQVAEEVVLRQILMIAFRGITADGVLIVVVLKSKASQNIICFLIVQMQVLKLVQNREGDVVWINHCFESRSQNFTRRVNDVRLLRDADYIAVVQILADCQRSGGVLAGLVVVIINYKANLIILIGLDDHILTGYGICTFRQQLRLGVRVDTCNRRACVLAGQVVRLRAQLVGIRRQLRRIYGILVLYDDCRKFLAERAGELWMPA